MDHETAFWLKDFCQKLLPVKFCEGQKDYFGKKGLSLHVDVFIVKNEDVFRKHVYFTCLQQCDQSMTDVLGLADIVLDKFKEDEPTISKLFTKSDNAGCYHASLVPEALFKMCKDKGFRLLRYDLDYNEPCKGKDQCDRESAAAKTIIRSFVDAGNDLISADDVYKSLHYGSGMKDGQISVAEADSERASLTGKKIDKFTSFHSIEFHDQHMQLWRYYAIGTGVTQMYSSTEFVSGFTIKKPFSKTDKRLPNSTVQTKKVRADRQLNTIFFCNEPHCPGVFKNNHELEMHILSGNHNEISEKSSMDKVRKSFVSKMKLTSELHVPITSTDVKIAEIDIETACQLYPTMSMLSGIGWALPVRSNFRYSYAQKKVLYEYFMAGGKER